MKLVKMNPLNRKNESGAGNGFNRLWRTAAFAGLLRVASGRAANGSTEDSHE